MTIQLHSRFSITTSSTPFYVEDIVWDSPNANLPDEATVWLSDDLVDSDPADSTEGAIAAWESEWEVAIKKALEAQHGAKVLEIGGYEPD